MDSEKTYEGIKYLELKGSESCKFYPWPVGAGGSPPPP